MDHREPDPRPALGGPTRLSMNRLFAEELRGLAEPIAAELEDHLAEETARWKNAGLSAEEARRRALEQLGDLRQLAREMGDAGHDPVWGAARIPWALRLLCLGWVMFGLLVLSRICGDESLSFPLIWGCVGLGIAGAGVGLMVLRRREKLRRWALGTSLAVAALFVAKTWWALGQEPWLPLNPLLLPVIALGALGSAWVLGRRHIREHFV